MPSTWTPIVFWFLLVPLLIVMFIVYLRSKKFYRLVYILSVFTYAMTIMYWIDSYKLGRNAIVGLLVASSLLMIFLGWRMHSKDTKRKTTHKDAQLAIFSIAIIAIIVGISAAPIGWTVTSSTVPSIRLSDVTPILEEGQPSYASAIPIHTITVKNTFIPKQYELPQATGCLYNTQMKAGQGANVFWDIQQQYSDFGQGLNVMEVGRGTKTATLKISSSPYYRPAPMETKPVKFEPQVWNELYLFLNEGRTYEYIDCYTALSPEVMAKAIRISITQD